MEGCSRPITFLVKFNVLHFLWPKLYTKIGLFPEALEEEKILKKGLNSGRTWKNGTMTSVTAMRNITIGIPMKTLKGRTNVGSRIRITITPKMEAEYSIHCACRGMNSVLCILYWYNTLFTFLHLHHGDLRYLRSPWFTLKSYLDLTTYI